MFFTNITVNCLYKGGGCDRHFSTLFTLLTISAENAVRNYKPFQHITGACRALAQGDYTYHHNQAANTVH
jgi:hypothetical protein